MKALKIPLLILLLMCLAGFAGFSMHQALNENRTSITQSSLSSPADMLLIGLPRPDFSLTDLDGNNRSISQWDGKIIVLNFWASWCPPCRKEIPDFVDLQKKYADQNVQFVGLAIDTPDNIRQFLETTTMNYPNLISETEGMKISSLYGNDIGALPYTVIINQSGKMVFLQKGALHKEKADKLISALLNP